MQQQQEQTRPPSSGSKPEVTIRHGAIGGSVFRQETGNGESFYTFSISRAWKSDAAGKSGYSTSFTERNVAELHKTIDECADWIRSHQTAPSSVTAEPASTEESSIPF